VPPPDPWLSGDTALDVALVAHADAQALAQRQATRLAALLEAAASGSPLYRRLLAGRDPANVSLSTLPPVRKAELMAKFDEWVADPHLRLPALCRFTADRRRIAQPFNGRYVVWESSGSSGEPGIFVQDAQAMAVYDALEALRRPVLRPLQRLLDPWCLAERIAFVGAIDGHFASTVSIERLRRFNPMLAGRLHSVSFLQPAAGMVAQLNAIRPTVIATYPSAAVLLAEEYGAGRLRHAPSELWTGGEELSASQRQFLRRAFECPVANSYGASEFLALASDCAQGRLHLNSDWVILEAVDARGHAVAAGQHGSTTLLTNLANHVQPLIRYDLGDRVTLHAHTCECGSPLPVIEVQGRCDDTLMLARAGAPPVRVLPLALCTVVEEEAALFDFQLVQQAGDAFVLRTGLVGCAGQLALHRGRRALETFLAAQGVPKVHIRCESGQPARRGRTGKIQRVVALAR
jgi:phenylacetate-coenzyme A ligase PaaK-like adenylate-forming protein